MKIKTANMLVLLALLSGANCLKAGVVFTNLVLFTYTNGPDYGWNFEIYLGHASALVPGADGNFYGTTFEGGANYIQVTSPATYGYGTVYKLTPAGAFTTVYSFGNNPPHDGRGPEGNLIGGSDGNIYGTTWTGGNLPGVSEGTIFQITTNGGFASVYSFGHNMAGNPNFNYAYTNTDGGTPVAGLVQDGAGNFYGTTTGLGSGDQGTIYQLTPGGVLKTLHMFPYDTNAAFSVEGGNPISELTAGPDGNFYGTTYWGGTNGVGTIFRITTNGTFTALYSFGIPGYFGYIGANPYAPMLLGKDGSFYGVAGCSGNSANGSGIIFRFTTNGVLTVLHQFYFAGSLSSLIQGSDGNFYGTTSQGGQYAPPYGGGTVFQMTTNGAVTTLYSFRGTDGYNPESALVQAKDGSLYGTTSYGGPGFNGSVNTGYGTIFRIIIPPTFQSITPTNGGVSLTWSILPGQTYQLQYTTDLTATNWLNLGSSITASNTTAATTDNYGSDAQRFYRIVLTQ